MARPIATLAAVTMLGVFAAVVVALWPGDRIAAGVRVAGLDVGGSTRAEALQRLADAPPRSVTLIDGTSSRTIALDELGIAPQADAAVAAALSVGHDGDPLARLADRLGAAIRGRDIPMARAVIDAGTLGLTLTALAGEIDRPMVEGDVRITDAGVAVREPQTGRVLDRSRLVDMLLAAGDPSPSLALPIITIVPRLDAPAIADARVAAVAAYAPLTLVAGSERVVIPASDVARLVRIAEVDTGDGSRLVVSTDAAAVAALAAGAASRLDGDAREAVLVPGGERFAVEPGRDAVRVDVLAAAQAIERAVFASDRTTTLPAEVTHPRLTTEAAERFAESVSLVGAYTTYFPVNWARARNIGAAAATFDGMTVTPGESFSFWDRIGEVSTRTGYVYAGTIIGGVSTYAIGGGLCQVSTTFFNAVIRGGYRIDERHEHSYYIERYPLGLDAAVFAGQEDMRWTNDTGVPVHIRAQGTDTSVTFWLYSAPTGRSVEIGEVQQWDLRWPYPGQPADPQHAPGYVVPGRDTLAIRTVLQDGVAISRDEWHSHYAPVWGGPG